MAYVRFITPFTNVTGTNNINVEADNVRDLCKKLVQIFGKEMSVILDEKEELSQKMVLLVNRRNAHTLEGANTFLEKDTEIIIMHYIVGG
jgi:molybdopterin converting factor small subunit